MRSPVAGAYMNPWSDRAFVDEVSAEIEDGVTDAGELQERLRQSYPGVVVRRRGLVGEPESWYVYRDGYWVNPERESRADTRPSTGPTRDRRRDRRPAVFARP